jgi:hypothetical protein
VSDRKSELHIASTGKAIMKTIVIVLVVAASLISIAAVSLVSSAAFAANGQTQQNR